MDKTQGLNRRSFLKTSSLGMVGAGLAGSGATIRGQEAPSGDAGRIKAYRPLGRTGFRVSDISSGGPTNLMVLKALLDAGVNYIDTAESYEQGQSERMVGDALKGRERKKFFVTTKLELKKDRSKEGILDRVRKSLERLQTGYIDCLMMHSATKAETLKAEGFHEAVKVLKSEGRLRFVGVSNHGGQWQDESESMDQVLLAAAEDGRFDVMLMVYNFVQREMAERVLAACREKNIGVTLMKTNPVGNYLKVKQGVEKREKEGKEVPEYYRAVLARMKKTYDAAAEFIEQHKLSNPDEIRDAAVRFVLGHPAVSAVCISFGNFGDVDTYLKLSGSRLSADDKKKLSAFNRGLSHLYCRHACGICEASCPQGVPVNTVMRYNHYFDAQGREKHAMIKYANLTTAKADRCESCTGHCEAACPYGVPIQGLLGLAHRTLSLV